MADNNASSSRSFEGSQFPSSVDQQQPQTAAGSSRETDAELDFNALGVEGDVEAEDALLNFLGMNDDSDDSEFYTGDSEAEEDASQASSVEPDRESTEVAEETEHVGPRSVLQLQPIEYGMQSRVDHHQVADALSCQSFLDERMRWRSQLLLTTVHDPFRTSVASHWIDTRQTPTGLSALTAQEGIEIADISYSPYSITRSPSGQHIAVCGAKGCFSLFDAGPLMEVERCGEEAQEGLADQLEVRHLITGLIPGDAIAAHRDLRWVLPMVEQFNMNNSVRFCRLWGGERVIVACQFSEQFSELMQGHGGSGRPRNYAYVMNVPSPSGAARFAEQLSCVPEGLRPPAAPRGEDGTEPVRVRVLPVVVTLEGNSPSGALVMVMTAAIGPFSVELNCVSVSPDGRWIAVALDMLQLLLLRMGEGERSWHIEETIEVDISLGHSGLMPGEQSGAQYVDWNASSTMVAVTTDFTRRVFVYDVRERCLVGGSHFRQHDRPCLAIRWSPFDDGILAYAEAQERVYVMDVRSSSEEDPWGGCDKLRVPPSANGFPNKVNGLGWGGSRFEPQLFVATRRKLLRWPVAGTRWSSAVHRLYPPRFREAVAEFLRCAHADKQAERFGHAAGSTLKKPRAQPENDCRGARDQFGLWQLPKEVLLKIVAFAAEPFGAWT